MQQYLMRIDSDYLKLHKDVHNEIYCSNNEIHAITKDAPLLQWQLLFEEKKLLHHSWQSVEIWWQLENSDCIQIHNFWFFHNWSSILHWQSLFHSIQVMISLIIELMKAGFKDNKNKRDDIGPYEIMNSFMLYFWNGK